MFFSGETETNIYAQVLQKAGPCPCCPWSTHGPPMVQRFRLLAMLHEGQQRADAYLGVCWCLLCVGQGPPQSLTELVQEPAEVPTKREYSQHSTSWFWDYDCSARLKHVETINNPNSDRFCIFSMYICICLSHCLSIFWVCFSLSSRFVSLCLSLCSYNHAICYMGDETWVDHIASGSHVRAIFWKPNGC